jgi:hypothetical protein
MSNFNSAYNASSSILRPGRFSSIRNGVSVAAYNSDLLIQETIEESFYFMKKAKVNEYKEELDKLNKLYLLYHKYKINMTIIQEIRKLIDKKTNEFSNVYEEAFKECLNNKDILLDIKNYDIMIMINLLQENKIDDL